MSKSFVSLEARKPRRPKNQAVLPLRTRARRAGTANVDISSGARLPGVETVLTPAGRVPKSKVHFVPKGARVHRTTDSIQIIGADGKVIHSTPVSKPNSTHISTPAVVTTEDITSGWNAYTWCESDPDDWPITNFSTAWAVPDAPSTYDDQGIFIGNILSTDDSTAMLEPTLQYGESAAGGGEYWSIASWYFDGDEAYYSTLVEVSSGTLLTGIMQLTDFDEDYDWDTDTTTITFYWNCTFSGYPDTSYDISTTEEFIYALEGLETYDCTQDSDLPSGTTKMESIYLQAGFYCPSLSWNTQDDATDDIDVEVVTDGSVNGEVDISYPT
ncbi:hypothetical protein BD410DRAFT_357725 [Rickenella mellea]|uniref:Uncharacterized protein n=1 Tax=Rickenella mellea TaxID=50990 RepID=A0A4Y7Q1Y2_9AGAM|nr:hypothetical protein BD410DRAFT_357725 [Rickenella mellea]